jgi:DNA-binding FadR family transcriptional regulator
MKEFPTIVTASLAKQIAESLREMILSGQVKVDERLPTEEELAARFGVSRPTIREALKRLAAENLIHSRRGPQGGTLVKRPSPEDLSATLANTVRFLASFGDFRFEEIFEARCALETACCRIMTNHVAATHLEKMRTELEEQRKSSLSDEQFCASDVRFHRILVEATENSILQYILFAIGDALQPITNLVTFRFRDRNIICDQHQRLIDAIAIGATDEAVVVLKEQAEYQIESYRKAKGWQEEREQARARSSASLESDL